MVLNCKLSNKNNCFCALCVSNSVLAPQTLRCKGCLQMGKRHHSHLLWGGSEIWQLFVKSPLNLSVWQLKSVIAAGNICASAQHEEGEPQLRSDKQPAGGWAGSHCRRLAPWSLLCRRNYLSTEQAPGAVCFVLKSCRRLIIAARRKRIKTSSRFCYGSFFLLVVGVCWKGMGARSAGGRGLCWDQERCPEGDHSILSPLLLCRLLWRTRGDLAALSLFIYMPTLPSPWGPVDHLCWVSVSCQLRLFLLAAFWRFVHPPCPIQIGACFKNEQTKDITLCFTSSHSYRSVIKHFIIFACVNFI